MKLVPIYFPFENDLGFIKAIVYDTDLEFFEPLGTFYRSSEDIPVDTGLEDENVNIVVEVGGRELSLPEEMGKAIDPTDGFFPAGPLEEVFPEAVLSTPDEGFGKPGSLKFHTHFITSFKTIDEVGIYMEKVTGQSFDVKGSLTVVKNRALRLLKGLVTDG